MMDRRSIHTSNTQDIAFLAYDEENQIMEIDFRNDGKFQYFDVPPEEYETLLNEESQWSYFADHIKDHFRFIRL